MTILFSIVAAALIAVGYSIGRASYMGEFGRNPFVPMVLSIIGLAAGVSIYLAIGGA